MQELDMEEYFAKQEEDEYLAKKRKRNSRSSKKLLKTELKKINRISRGASEEGILDAEKMAIMRSSKADDKDMEWLMNKNSLKLTLSEAKKLKSGKKLIQGNNEWRRIASIIDEAMVHVINDFRRRIN